MSFKETNKTARKPISKANSNSTLLLSVLTEEDLLREVIDLIKEKGDRDGVNSTKLRELEGNYREKYNIIRKEFEKDVSNLVSEGDGALMVEACLKEREKKAINTLIKGNPFENITEDGVEKNEDTAKELKMEIKRIFVKLETSIDAYFSRKKQNSETLEEKHYILAKLDSLRREREREIDYEALPEAKI